MSKPYIVCLKYGTWRNELWFSAEESDENESKWNKAVAELPAVSAGCVNSNEYMSAAIELIESRGFTRIQR